MIKTANKYTVRGTVTIEVELQVIADDEFEAVDIARERFCVTEYSNGTVGFDVDPEEIDDYGTENVEFIDCTYYDECEFEDAEFDSTVDLEFEDPEEDEEEDDEEVSEEANIGLAFYEVRKFFPDMTREEFEKSASEWGKR